VQLLRCKWSAEQFVQAEQRGCRIAAAPAQAGRQRNALVEFEPHTVLDSRRLQKQRRGTMDQISGVCGQAGRAAAQFNALALPGKGQPVKHPDRVEHRFQVVKAIRAPAENVQQQVDLAGRLLFQ